jgi:hypothetical protein
LVHRRRGCGVFIPFVPVSVLDLQHDVFYLVYFATTAAMLVAYVQTERVDIWRIVTHAWPWSLGPGIVIGVAQVYNVLGEDATDRPSGAYFVSSASGAASPTAWSMRCCSAFLLA